MTIVNHETGEIAGPTFGEVKDSVNKAKTSLEAAAEQIIWQIENRVWLVLGYETWNEMREQEYGGAAFMVPRAERPELVARMKAQGLTNVEIADTAGVTEGTVRNDLNRNSAIEDDGTARPPRPNVITNSRGQQRPASYAPRPAPGPTVEDVVREFPDLAYYAETDRDRALLMADDLRRARERGDLDQRLDNLRRSIAVDRAKQDGTYRPGTTAVMSDAGTYEMRPLATPKPITRTCPACHGRGVVEEKS